MPRQGTPRRVVGKKEGESIIDTHKKKKRGRLQWRSGVRVGCRWRGGGGRRRIRCFFDVIIITYCSIESRKNNNNLYEDLYLSLRKFLCVDVYMRVRESRYICCIGKLKTERERDALSWYTSLLLLHRPLSLRIDLYQPTVFFSF